MNSSHRIDFTDLIEIFVDESKPAYATSPEERPLLYFARGFPFSARLVWESLKDYINRAEVKDWHSKSFLQSPFFKPILQCIHDAKYAAPGFLLVRKHSDFSRMRDSGYLRKLIAKNPDTLYFRDFPWNPDSIEATALFYFIDKLLIYCGYNRLKPLVYFDLPKDVFLPAIEDIPSYRDKGFVGGHYGGYSVHGISKKMRKAAFRNMVHWINLADGELWILQKLQQMELTDGKSIWTRVLELQAGHRNSLLSQKDLEYIKDHGAYDDPYTEEQVAVNERFYEYVTSLLNWIDAGYVVQIESVLDNCSECQITVTH